MNARTLRKTARSADSTKTNTTNFIYEFMMFAHHSTSLNAGLLPNLHYKISLQRRLDRMDNLFSARNNKSTTETDDNNIDNDYFQEVKLHDKSKCMYTIARC